MNKQLTGARYNTYQIHCNQFPGDLIINVLNSIDSIKTLKTLIGRKKKLKKTRNFSDSLWYALNQNTITTQNNGKSNVSE